MKIEEMETADLQRAKSFLNGKNIIFQSIGILNMFFAVGGFIGGASFWWINAAAVMLAAHSLKDVPYQLDVIKTELESRGKG